MSRTIEEKILQCWNAGKIGTRNLSMRDVVTYNSYIKCYQLWGHTIVMEHDNRVFICTCSAGATNSVISHTTKSRLNAFLLDYGFNCIFQRNWKILFTSGTGITLELTPNTVYELDFNFKTLVEYKD